MNKLEWEPIWKNQIEGTISANTVHGTYMVGPVERGSDFYRFKTPWSVWGGHEEHFFKYNMTKKEAIEICEKLHAEHCDLVDLSVYLRDVDGTGSLHVCLKESPGAIEFIRKDNQ